MSAKRTFRCLAAATVLASALAVVPARAEYETAVADYEQGAYDAAYEEFRRLANLGDDRSRRFLQRMRDEGLLAAVRPSSKGDATESRQGAAYDISIPWRPFRLIPENLEDIPEWSVVWPSRQSLLSTFYHMPADVTVVGLQHVARFLEADRLNWDLRGISRQGNILLFAVLAAWWWFLFMRAVWALGGVLLDLVKAILSLLGLVTNE